MDYSNSKSILGGAPLRFKFWGKVRRPPTPTINVARTNMTPTHGKIPFSVSSPTESTVPNPMPSNSSKIVSKLDPEAPINVAIKRLNTSITRLFQVNRALESECNLSDGATESQSSEVDITDINFEIERLGKLTNYLLASEKTRNDAQECRQIIPPATTRFVKTACRAVAPAAKAILAAVSNSSTSVISSIRD